MISHRRAYAVRFLATLRILLRISLIVQEMRADGLQPSTINYNLALRALGKGGDWERAMDLLDEMEALDVVRDERTFGAAIEVQRR